MLAGGAGDMGTSLTPGCFHVFFWRGVVIILNL